MSGQNQLSEKELISAVELLRTLLPGNDLDQIQPMGPAAVYTALVTTWMMILQRLGGGKSLVAVVKDMIANNKALLPDNKRLREETLSTSSGAFSRARSRLKLETIEHLARHVCQSLVELSPPWFKGRRAYLIDGTTITLAPTKDMKNAFPPATNQHGESVWPVLQMLVVHELQSGCALLPQIGAMYGDDNTSEAKLSHQMARELPANSLILADSNFGIFSVAWAMQTAGHDFLFRLSAKRYKSLAKKAILVEEWNGHTTHRLTWKPTSKDRQSNPNLPADACINVLIHNVPLEQTSLNLVTVLSVNAETAGELYSHRYSVEHDIRDVKVTLGIEKLRATSEEMAKKELLTSLIAYNLVIQFRRQAAKQVNLDPRRLSFTGVWNTLESFLLNQPPCDAVEWTRRFERAIIIASKDKLPNRPGRSYPRKAHSRSPKSTKFMKKASQDKEDPPPNDAK